VDLEKNFAKGRRGEGSTQTFHRGGTRIRKARRLEASSLKKGDGTHGTLCTLRPKCLQKGGRAVMKIKDGARGDLGGKERRRDRPSLLLSAPHKKANCCHSTRT